MAFQGDSIYWVELEKVVPNPFQPRREFDQKKLEELSESIRMYGVLQPLTVTRNEVQRDDGTFYTEYELIAGERRLRASKLAGVAQVPVIIREGEQSEQEKLELAIIENLQREDLNAVDRALAFRQLADSFGLSHAQVAEKVGRSREYVSNSIRLLGLPDHILDALKHGDLMEGHARTLLMLTDKPEEQEVIFKEIVLKKLSVREVERIVRKIATDKVRKRNATDLDVNLIALEKQFTETLGTRVQILKTDFGGKLTIDYFSEDDLATILKRMREEAVSEIDAAVSVTEASRKMSESTGVDVADLTQTEPKTEVAQMSPVSEPAIDRPEEVSNLGQDHDKSEAEAETYVNDNLPPSPTSEPVTENNPTVVYPSPEAYPTTVNKSETVPETPSDEVNGRPLAADLADTVRDRVEPEADISTLYRSDLQPDMVESSEEVTLPDRNEIKDAISEFNSLVAENQQVTDPVPENPSTPVADNRTDDDESDLYSIRNFNV